MPQNKLSPQLQQRVDILTQAVAQGKQLDPQHQAEYDNYVRMGVAKPGANTVSADAISKAGEVFDSIGKADNLIGTGNTGTIGAMLHAFSPAAGSDLQGQLNAIKSNLAFEELQKMRANSPTGGAVGNVSDTDMRLLSSTVADLDRTQSADQLRDNLKKVAQHYGDMLKRMGYSDDQISKIPGASNYLHLAAPPPNPGGGNGVPGGPSVPSGPDLGTNHPARMNGEIGFNQPKTPANPLTAEQQAAYDAWNKANPHATADQLRAFAGSMGINLANAESIVAARDKGAGVRSAGSARIAPVNAGDGRMGSFARGVTDAATLNLMPRMTALSETVRHGGTYDQNLAIQQGYREYDEQNHPWFRIAGSVPGALAIPAGAVNDAATAARVGAAQGAAYGYFGSPDLTDVGQSGMNALAGAGAGAAGGYLLTKGGNALANRISSMPTRLPPGGADAVDIARAGQAEGVPLSRPVVDPAVRDRMSYLESNLGSGGTVRNALANTRNAIEQRATKLGGTGTAQEPGVLGEQVQSAGQRFIDKSRNVGRKLYDRAAALAGNNKVNASDAVATLDQHIANLSENANANAPLISYLKEIRADLTDANGNVTPKSIAALRDLRTSLRGQISSRNLTATDAERRIGEVLDAAKGDISRDLNGAAPQAVRAYDQADKFWQQRQSEIKQVVQAFIGPKDNPLSGEKVVARLKSMASPRGDSARLARMLDKLTPDERADVAATIASNLGRRSPEDEFSPALFVSSARALSPAARNTIFGPEGAKSIENLRHLSEALRDTESRLNNSRSGQVVNWKTTIRELLGGSVAGAGVGVGTGSPVGGIVTGTALAGAGAVARRLSARALMSPDMSRWLVATPKLTTKAAMLAHIGRLADVAKRDPAIAQEATGLRQFLLKAMNDNAPMAGSVAASPDQGPDKQQKPEGR